jgi:ribosome-binding protein aMBF1 (putative translation factor)
MVRIKGMIIENIAKAIKKSGKSRYQIAKDTGIDQAVLCRIATGSGTGSCTTKTADILCKYLGLELLPKKAKPKRQVKYEK